MPVAVAAAVLVSALSGCSTLPRNVDRQASSAFTDTADTRLGRAAAASVGTMAAGESGVRLIDRGEDAFATLHTLIADAERSLDLQYYIVEDDPYARALLRGAREAAERGVRVRLLVDDMYTTGRDDRIAWYAAHPNIEVRVFNPFGLGRPWLVTRIAASITDLGRINHRMHNKLLVADNALAVTGGRNLGASYYARSDRTNFLDMDVLVAGPVVQDLSDGFDRYWNSAYAYPIENLVGKGDLERSTVDTRALLDPNDPVRKAAGEARRDGAALQAAIDTGRLALIAAPAEALVDRPSKVDRSAPRLSHGWLRSGDTIATDVLAIIASASDDVLIVTPYFVPGRRGVGLLGALTARGVKVSVVTNSLASTDAAIVHIGYSHYRKALLEHGVELFEVRPTPGTENERLSGLGSSKASLHAKVIVVDHRTVFIGSFNADQRSSLENTEMGLRIESPELADQIVGRVRGRGEERRYQVTLDGNGKLEWTSRDDGIRTVLHDEPDVSGWLEFALRVLAPFAPEEML